MILSESLSLCVVLDAMKSTRKKRYVTIRTHHGVVGFEQILLKQLLLIGSVLVDASNKQLEGSILPFDPTTNDAAFASSRITEEQIHPAVLRPLAERTPPHAALKADHAFLPRSTTPYRYSTI